MAIEFECPNCRTHIRTPDEAAGKKARCPKCQQISPVPLSSSLPSASSFPAAPAPAPKSVPQANPFGDVTASNAPWLPPADAFAPQGPPQPFAPTAGPSYMAPPAQPQSTNPFGDQPPAGNRLNPYQSPAGYASGDQTPLRPEELRQKLMGPAIGMTLGSAVCIGVIAFFSVLIWLDEDFHADIKGADQAETMGAYIAFAFFVLVGIVPSLLALMGPWAMFRGRGLVTAWLGTIVALFPCNPCFFLTAGFAIWGMVVLSDPRVSKGMQ